MDKADDPVDGDKGQRKKRVVNQCEPAHKIYDLYDITYDTAVPISAYTIPLTSLKAPLPLVPHIISSEVK